MKQQIIRGSFEGTQVSFSADGWFNATEAAEKYGKRVDHWLANKETREYLQALGESLNTRNSGDLIRAKRGASGGTWLHPKIAVVFARWCDVRFAVWCDFTIDQLIRGSGPAFDPVRLRHEAASSFKVMQEILTDVRQEIGKATASHHYSNEARMINWSLTGEFKGLDRDKLSASDLHILARLEERNAVLIGRGLEYANRKIMIEQYAVDLRGSPLRIEE